MSETTIPLFKMNGAGNKILVADLRAAPDALTGEKARRLGEHEILHFDQLMAIEPAATEGTRAYVTIYNIDGSEAEACGNGTRCVADILMNAEGGSDLNLETRPGVLAAQRRADGLITVDMGTAKFDWEDIPLAEEFRDTRAIELQVGPIDDPVLHSPSVASMGNPHAIFWVDGDVDGYGLERFGPLLENHPIFPERANISVARVTGEDRMDLKVWERGVGLTLACGSAACAAVASSYRTGRTRRSVQVRLPGGVLQIDVMENYRILMTGPVEYEAVGVVDLKTLEWEMVPTSDPFGLAGSL
ncbi:MAG: diaminopimelate epimerase [Pseudomonadota bacterium]